MHDATDVPEPRTAPDLLPIAFIYDRQATKATVLLDERIARVKAYAESQGWQIGGWFVDTDTDALSDTSRPALDALCNAMANTSDAELICLVHDSDRLSRDTKARAALQRRVHSAGGTTRTAQGESDREPRDRGTLAAFRRSQT